MCLEIQATWSDAEREKRSHYQAAPVHVQQWTREDINGALSNGSK